MDPKAVAAIRAAEADFLDMLSDAIQDAYSEGDGEMKPRRLVEALAHYGYEIVPRRNAGDEINEIRKDLAAIMTGGPA